MTGFKNQKGDTIIEVLLALVIVSVIITSAVAIGNRSSRINQTAYERTDIVNIMREQAELIKAVKKKDSLAKSGIAKTVFVETDPCAGQAKKLGFHLTIDNSGKISDVKGAYTENFYNVWIEQTDVATTTDPMVFTIRACWEGIGSEGVQTSGLVVRVPREDAGL